jgi:hypothetical protein
VINVTRRNDQPRVAISEVTVTMTYRTAFAALLKLTFAASIVAVMGAVAAAQSYPRSEVEVRLGRP